LPYISPYSNDFGSLSCSSAVDDSVTWTVVGATSLQLDLYCHSGFESSLVPTLYEVTLSNGLLLMRGLNLHCCSVWLGDDPLTVVKQFMECVELNVSVSSCLSFGGGRRLFLVTENFVVDTKYCII
jgi:hypothetical protein